MTPAARRLDFDDFDTGGTPAAAVVLEGGMCYNMGVVADGILRDCAGQESEVFMEKKRIWNNGLIKLAAALLLLAVMCMACVFPAAQAADEELTLSNSGVSIGYGEIFRLTANKSVTWRTSASGVASVDKNGNVRGNSCGSAVITAVDSRGKTKNCRIAVRKAPDKVQMSQPTLTLGVGESFSLSSSLPSYAASAKREYRTSHPWIVKMTKTNWTASFKAIKEGVAWVTVRTFNGREASCKITVRKAPQKITLDRGLMILKEGQTASLNMMLPQNSGCALRTFRTSNPNAVKMTKTSWTANFKAENEGIAYVTGRTYNGKEASCKIVVQRNGEKEMIGVWVPYMAIDLDGTDRSEKTYTGRVDEIMKSIKDIGANTVVFQIHPFCDSIYYSTVFPSSHLLSGTQGQNVSYDGLKIAIKSARKYGLKFHAWINPMRITYNGVPSTLADNNPYMIWKNDNSAANDRFGIEYDMGINLNPAYPQVRKLITNAVSEIVQNYDVDGILIDDYFYPVNFDDSYEYEEYKKVAGNAPLSLQKWREANINTLVKGIYNAVHKKANCVFGIAPQGNYENNYLLSADVKTWCTQKGYADYICPQLYVSMDHPFLPFGDTVKFWRNLITENSVRLYFGIALYKIGTDSDSGTWLQRDDNIKAEVQACRGSGANGFMIYSCQQLSDPLVKEELKKAQL